MSNDKIDRLTTALNKIAEPEKPDDYKTFEGAIKTIKRLKKIAGDAVRTQDPRDVPAILRAENGRLREEIEGLQLELKIDRDALKALQRP